MKKEKNFYIKWASVLVIALFLLSSTPSNISAEENEYVTVQVSKWMDDDSIVIVNESWLESDYYDFLNGVEAAWSEDDKGIGAEQFFSLCKEYDIIPQNKTQEELFERLEMEYIANQEVIPQQQGGAGGTLVVNCWMWGYILSPFELLKMIRILYYEMESVHPGPELAGQLRYYSFLTGQHGNPYACCYLYMEVIVYVGIWFPPFIAEGTQYLTRIFAGHALFLTYAVS